MTGTKINYGIDLGTTNSAIACMSGENIQVVKSEKWQKDTTPSCVYFGKKTNFVGDDALIKSRSELSDAFREFTRTGALEHAVNSFVEFKRTMGTDVSYFSSNKNSSYTSEELSAEVVTKLKSYVIEEDVRAAVITIPMRFEQHQMDATQRAAKLAGFEYFELLQEPIAASLAYGIDKKIKNGNWLVFDFGGGTFDAALMKAEEGIMKVIDTAGDTQLGGKDIDNIIVDEIIMPHLKRSYSIDSYLENKKALFLLQGTLNIISDETKIMMSSKNNWRIDFDEPLGTDEEGEEIEVDMELTIEDFEEVVGPVFQRAIDISLELLKNNHITSSDLASVIMVGGPTFSQTLRTMVREQISPKVDTSIDPMTCVARGAAFLAATKDIPLNLQERDKTKIQLLLKHPKTTVEPDVKLGIRIERTQTEGYVPDKLFAEITSADNQWSSGRIEIEKDADIITIPLQPDRPNSFTISLYDEKGSSYPCEPSSFIIIQGVVPSKQIISEDICFEAFDVRNEKALLRKILGLKKNQTLPAKGKFIGKTQQDIRPGRTEDVIRISVYNGQPGSRSVYNEHAGTVNIRGDELPGFLPEGSEVEVTLYVDESHGITLIADFPYLDHAVEKKKLESHIQKEFDPEDILENIERAQQELSSLDDGSSEVTWKETEKLEDELQQLEDELEQRSGDRDAKIGIMGRLRKIMKRLDKLENESAWPTAEENLRDALERIEITNEQYGNEKTEKVIEGFQHHAQEIMDKEDPKLANKLIEEINSLGFALVGEQIGLWISWLKDYDEEFETYKWKDRREARRLIEEGKRIANSNPTVDQLRPVVMQIVNLLPEPEKPALTKKDRELLETE